MSEFALDALQYYGAGAPTSAAAPNGGGTD
ncbi:hypothetical protein SAMN06295955_101598 [Sphingopyxis indica]|uniref:Uncharacterized protein n=1 Tax=Sphingopyxis indica TaxID=436663 RepID=A0A239E574_9SPHN|nr:hypothetical protein SAMN06295955_101598 [Sphingopyxis indica]